MGNRYDVTPIFADANCFTQLVEDLSEPFQNSQVEFVACVDALGFILGTAIALRLNAGIIPIRKGGKLPVEADSVEFRDYSGEVKRLEIRRDILPPQACILLVDEWIETGAQVQAAAQLIERRGGIIVGIASINMDENATTAAIAEKYTVHTVWETEP